MAQGAVSLTDSPAAPPLCRLERTFRNPVTLTLHYFISS